ncbi:acetoin utilization protein AcuC [Roseiterribacter gracilis]|uniref:Acetoin utilization protein AcuC n=1 Tax=Roseiterribacter gracilis TaxID=2812848 RepID=A0A8S8XAH8_9PROT|nr:acetoin utilization protein AcuC [Rhodospirillales bacterium TMPK1]
MTAKKPLLLGHEIYRASSYGAKHPLAIPRVSTVLDLTRALGWLPDAQFRESPLATEAQLTRFHDPAYVQAIRDGERDQTLDPDRRERFNLGKLENPIFGEMFRRPATSAGGSALAATLLADGVTDTVHHPAGGTHHARRDRASGFCYFNDPALAILHLLDRGAERIAYVDLDAHHGDGVEEAFVDDHRVLTLSVHEEGRWPKTGPTGWRTATAGNVAVAPGFHDAELDLLVAHVLVPAVTQHDPDVIVLQCGADGLTEDPLSRLELSNRALWRAIARLLPLAPRRLVLGGGGYNPWSVGRCWTGIWGLLNGYDAPARLPEAAEDVLRALVWNRREGRDPPDHWFTTLADAEPVPRRVRDALHHAVALMESSRPCA